jgi:hypothetical protein
MMASRVVCKKLQAQVLLKERWNTKSKRPKLILTLLSISRAYEGVDWAQKMMA